jgi:hypothetical protein
MVAKVFKLLLVPNEQNCSKQEVLKKKELLQLVATKLVF